VRSLGPLEIGVITASLIFIVLGLIFGQAVSKANANSIKAEVQKANADLRKARNR
jgi:hypothetical protein